MPKIGPNVIKPVIMITIENILLIKTYLLFSKAKNFDVYNIEIVLGMTQKLIIWIASIVSMYCGNRWRITIGKNIDDKIAINIEINIVPFLRFSFLIPDESCGRIYLKTMPENTISTTKNCNAKA